MTNEVSGRRILLALGAVIVVVCAGVGVFVGANAGQRTGAIELFGPVMIPATPTAFALYGGLVAAAALCLLFGAVTVATRLDAE